MKKTSKILSVIMVFALLVTSMMISTVSVQAADKVVLEWDFTEDAKDISGNGNDGVLGEGVTVADGVATFAAGNQGITLPEGVFGDAEVITIEMVVTPAKLGTNYVTLMGIGNEGDGEDWVVMALMADGAVRYAIVTDGLAEDKGNSTSGDTGSDGGTIEDRFELAVTAEEQATITYVIEQEVTTVYINGEEALILGTYDKSLVSGIEGPIVLGKPTHWPDPSFEGTMDSLKISIDDPASAPATEEPNTTEEPATTDAPATTAPAETATKAPATTAPSTTAPAASATADAGATDGGFPIWIVIVIAAVVIVVVVVVVVAKKKK